ncbi:MAG: ATP-binding protein, partial [Bacteroidaceae bacterium]|nr:ATP-binding protein [Bacteroidaceae bacterium]
MKNYLLYIVGLVALLAGLALSIKAHLLWPSIALGVALLWLCVSLYGRIERLLYAFHETEKENEKLHTRLAEAERQLQYLRQLTENVNTALFVCSTDGRIDWMNHAANAIATDTDTVLPDNILQAITEHAEMVDGCALSTVLLRIDGQRRLVVALKDVSALMQRQEMEAWQQLIRVLTHEIMNSLTPIISISETLTDEKQGSTAEGKVNEAFAVINRRCHSLLDFVESYRQLTRIKALERTTFLVSELFNHIAGLFPQVKTHGDGLLRADRAQLEQVLINLIKNASESGATKVEVSASDSEIRVKDNGSGMSPDILEHAFIPFFTTKPTGTG